MFVYAPSPATASHRPRGIRPTPKPLRTRGEQPPSGAGFNAPPRDGSLWFNNLLGSLFVYDAVLRAAGTNLRRSAPPAYGAAAPAPVTEGVTWIDSSVPST
jgi:hypothetical protein